MEIIGALKNSNSNSAVYFCDFKSSEFEKQAELKQQTLDLIRTSTRLEEIAKAQISIECVAIESNDEMKYNKKVVGVVVMNTDYENNDDIYYAVCDYDHLDLDPYLYDVLGIEFDN